ncbi:ring domain possible 4 transmembrane domains [Stylonychia lemnae]|uniref:Ring domain possible 4 transmembrane domains n=1 Tax=Stylonychia lemnae TaxID=5949 RepID=A0A078AMF0_STYLE|nr:ring domain possible 4 transmembrane domains [Stylonychia lemnae]|eukprot:CDW83560.1 ring domain possible 4 transmembrane domains [Stylonychia lemnae]
MWTLDSFKISNPHLQKNLQKKLPQQLNSIKVENLGSKSTTDSNSPKPVNEESPEQLSENKLAEDFEIQQQIEELDLENQSNSDSNLNDLPDGHIQIALNIEEPSISSRNNLQEQRRINERNYIVMTEEEKAIEVVIAVYALMLYSRLEMEVKEYEQRIWFIASAVISAISVGTTIHYIVRLLQDKFTHKIKNINLLLESVIMVICVIGSIILSLRGSTLQKQIQMASLISLILLGIRSLKVLLLIFLKVTWSPLIWFVNKFDSKGSKKQADQAIEEKISEPMEIERPNQQDIEIDMSCPICLNDFNEQSVITPLPCQSHFYHHQCIASWLKKNCVCPICRFQITKQNLKQSQKISK